MNDIFTTMRITAHRIINEETSEQKIETAMKQSKSEAAAIDSLVQTILGKIVEAFQVKEISEALQARPAPAAHPENMYSADIMKKIERSIAAWKSCQMADRPTVQPKKM